MLGSLDRLSSFLIPFFISVGSGSLGGDFCFFTSSVVLEPLGCCHVPCGLRVVLTPLYGSCRPWVIVTVPCVVVGEYMLELSCT